MMDFLNGNTRVLSHQYKMIGFTLLNCEEFIVVLYYFKGSGDFF